MGRLEINTQQSIEELDHEILTIISKRMKIVRKIGAYKKSLGIEILNKNRWREIVHKRIIRAKELGVPTNVIKKLFKLIHEYSLDIQKEG